MNKYFKLFFCFICVFCIFICLSSCEKYATVDDIATVNEKYDALCEKFNSIKEDYSKDGNELDQFYQIMVKSTEQYLDELKDQIPETGDKVKKEEIDSLLKSINKQDEALDIFLN